MAEPILRLDQLTVSAGDRLLVTDISCTISAGEVFGLIGPSGSGKSTLLRCINRLAELISGLRISGQVYFHGKPIYRSKTDPDALRARIGMLFQQPVIFPGSVLSNVLFGVRQLRTVPRSEQPQHAETMLRQVALWDEVKDRLHAPAQRLSVGQQQRLCLARTLALAPEVILMDEPTSALDPKSTEAIEELILRLKSTRSIVLVTHNLGQARRVADWLTCISVRDGAGEIAGSGCCDDILAESGSGEPIGFRAKV